MHPWFYRLAVILVGLSLLAGAACQAAAPVSPTPTAVAPSATSLPPTNTPTVAPPTVTSTPVPPTATLTSEPSTATPLPTDTPTISPTATSASAAAGGLPGGGGDTVRIFFIQEKTGGPICGDLAIGIGSGVPRSKNTAADLEAALKVLFSYRTEYVAGLYNPLYRSTLSVNQVEFHSSGLVEVWLTGKYERTKDKCDNSRVKAQVWSTVRQFRGVTATNIYLNAVPFGDLVSNDG